MTTKLFVVVLLAFVLALCSAKKLEIPVVPLYRFWNPSASDHFYTASAEEKEIVQNGNIGYTYEGIQGYCSPKNIPSETVALHRYWNPSKADHFYSTNALKELNGYTYEGVACYVFKYPAADRLPLHRYFRSGSHDHFYTTSIEEIGDGLRFGQSGRYGYVHEAIEGYLATSAQ